MHSSARSHRIGLIDQDAVLERRWQLEVVHTTAAHSKDGDVIGLPRRGEEIAGDGRGHEVAAPFDQRAPHTGGSAWARARQQQREHHLTRAHGRRQRKAALCFRSIEAAALFECSSPIPADRAIWGAGDGGHVPELASRYASPTAGVGAREAPVAFVDHLLPSVRRLMTQDTSATVIRIQSTCCP